MVLLLAGPLLVLAARFRPLPLRAANVAVVALTAPVERAITLVAFGAVDAWSGYVWLHGVHRENLRLRREVLQKQQQAQRAAELQAENGRLKALLDYVDKERPVRLLPAAVVAVGASPHSHSLRIARGSDDGVQRGEGVVSPDGVVGTIAQVAASYSDVQLITSPLSAVPALSQRTRSRSTVRGTGDVTRARLEYALRTDDLQDGDVLLTAGGSGFFPKGLSIGKVVSVQRRATGMFLSAEVLPAVDFSRLDEVLVVTSDPTAATAPATQAGALRTSAAPEARP